MNVGTHKINVGHADKLMYPADGITKLQVIDYYVRIADYMLPHIKNRPMVLVRYPDGIGQEGFFQKEASAYFPKWIRRASVKLVKGGQQHVVVVDSAATLAYLANQATLTFHIWLSMVGSLRKPDVMVFDLDPSDDDFSKVIAAARILKKILAKHGYKANLMTTGSRGLHLIISIKPVRDFDEVRKEAHDIAVEAVSHKPQLLTIEARIAKRGARVYVDIARNAYGQTRVAPYSLRALPGAPIATPIGWHELTSRLTPQKYNANNIFRRLAAISDPWE